MIGWSSFSRSVAFAAVAAVGWLPWLFVVGPFVGTSNARIVYLLGVTVLYAAGLSARPSRRIAIALATLVAGVGVVVVARSVSEVALGLAAVVGIARSAILYRVAPARAVAREVCLLGGGLVFARFLAGVALPSTAFALWGFLIVQSFFFLIGGEGIRRAEGRHQDPFDEAFRRATALLERTGI